MSKHITFQKKCTILSLLLILIVNIMTYKNTQKLVNNNIYHPREQSNHKQSNQNNVITDIKRKFPKKSKRNFVVCDVPGNGLEQERRKYRLPSVIIIGIMKCGTFALETMMEIHSKVAIASYKAEREVDFFNRNYKLGLEWYRFQMPYTCSDQISLEKSPKYTQITTNELPLRIHAMNSSIRLIMIVKDPVTRALSHYAHNDEKGRYKQSFEEAVLLPNGEVDSKPAIISYSIYETAFKLYLEVFSREQILVVDGDQLVQDPLPIVNKVEKFLNLDPEITIDNFYYNEEKGFYCLKKQNTRGCLKAQKGREHPEIDEKVLRKLRLFFAPYNKRFYDLVGHNFGWKSK